MLSLKTKLLSFLMPALVLVLPLVSSAENTFDSGYFDDIVGAIGNVVQSLIPILVGLLVVVFAWGVVKYIWFGAEGKESAKHLMIYSVIGIALVVSIWGVVNLLQGVFGINNTSSVTPPTVTGL